VCLVNTLRFEYVWDEQRRDLQMNLSCVDRSQLELGLADLIISVHISGF